MHAPSLPTQPKANKNTLWIVLGFLAVCGLSGTAIVAAILLPVLKQANFASQRAIALFNIREANTAIYMYSTDFDDRLPTAYQWMDLVEPFSRHPAVFRSPLATPDDKSDYGFAFRKELSQKNIKDFPDPVARAMIFDSTLLSRNATSGLETLPNPGRYREGKNQGNMIGLLSGYSEFTPDQELKELEFDGKQRIR